MADETKEWEQAKELKVGDCFYTPEGQIPIIGETARSWIIGYRGRERSRIRKKAIRELGNDGEHWPTYFLRKEDAVDAFFLRNERYSIGAAVQSCRDARVLRRVAELVGWKENTRA